MNKETRDVWFSRGMDDAQSDKPTRYPSMDDPIAAHIAYIEGRKFTGMGASVPNDGRSDNAQQRAFDTNTLDLY
tara:strand:+ start:6597 stop:6818 length:222 start_codon:yes stop_codon:yes gene_type:complete